MSESGEKKLPIPKETEVVKPSVAAVTENSTGPGSTGEKDSGTSEETVSELKPVEIGSTGPTEEKEPENPKPNDSMGTGTTGDQEPDSEGRLTTTDSTNTQNDGNPTTTNTTNAQNPVISSGQPNELLGQSPGAVAQEVANSSSSGIQGIQDQEQSTGRIQGRDQSISGDFASINFTIGTSSAENDFLKEMLECQMKINKEGGQISMDEFFKRLHDCEIQNITKHKITNGLSGLINKYGTITSLTQRQIELITSLTQICGTDNSGFDNTTLNSSQFIQYINTCIQDPQNKEKIKQDIGNYLSNPN
jgi:hypothetical protein